MSRLELAREVEELAREKGLVLLHYTPDNVMCSYRVTQHRVFDSGHKAGFFSDEYLYRTNELYNLKTWLERR